MALFGLFGGKKKDSPSVIGVDIGSSAIKVVQIRKKNGQAVLETYGELALGPYGNAAIGQAVGLPPERVATALADLMKEKEVNITSRLAGISIPFASSLMSLMEVPAVDPKRLSTMVPLEARKYIPVPITEVMLDWSVIPRPSSEEEEMGGKKLDILVVAIHKETVARYEDIAVKAGLTPGFLEIEVFSTMRSVLDEALTPTLIMDMGAATTKLYIVERGIVRASHTVNRGSQDITTAIAQSLGLSVEKAEVMKRDVGASGGDKTLTNIIALVLDYIFAEANRAILGFEKKYNKTVGKAILVGGGAALKGLSGLAKEAFKTEAMMGDPFSKLSAPAFIEDILKETGPEFAVSIGLALRKLQDEG